ncbi:hydramacin-1-like [Oculina patagonica]
MAFRRTFLLFVVFATCAFLNVSVVEGRPTSGLGNCYETWSRCSAWSKPLTGIVWQSCNGRCKCLGREGGTCGVTPSKCPLSKTAWQCQCHGTFDNPKPWWCKFST